MMQLARQRSNEDWIVALSQAGARRDAALTDLRALLLIGLRRALAGRTGVAEGLLEDFVQEALLKILDGLHSFRGESRFTTWALTIVTRVAFSDFRRRRWKDVSLDDAVAGSAWHPEDLVDTGLPLEAGLVRREALAILRRVLEEELTERQRRALLAEYSAGMPLEEVARRMGTNRNALYKLLHDARRKLRRGMLETGLTWEEIRGAFDV